MPLTPQDVQNKEFLTVRLREGYDMQEVDQFLDDVEAELRRLYDENERLREALSSGEPAPVAPPEPEVAQPGAAELGEAEPAAGPDVDAAREAAEEARVSDTSLQRAVSDSADAPAQALTILTYAQSAADNLVNEAQAKADELVTDATQKADTLVSTATQKAHALDAETEVRREELMGSLRAEESSLRTRLDDLRAHEREYRSRLVAYHSEQVRRLQEGQHETDVEVEGFDLSPEADVDAEGQPGSQHGGEHGSPHAGDPGADAPAPPERAETDDDGWNGS